MLLWFVGMSVLLVWLVFRSPSIDYRLVALGAVLPVGEVVLGGPRLLHTLVGAVALFGLVILATRGRRVLGRRWVGLPIGVMLHLVLDGVWTDTAVFLWPFFGVAFPPVPLPELDRGAGWTLVLELVGAAVLGWCYVAFGLTDATARARFLRTGHLPREAVAE